MSIKLRIVVATMFLSLTLRAPALFAQAVKGSIQGRVTDSTGAVLQGASVAVNPVGMRTATTTEGDFTIAGLPAGSYTVTIAFVGFKEFTQSVTVVAAET